MTCKKGKAFPEIPTIFIPEFSQVEVSDIQKTFLDFGTNWETHVQIVRAEG